MMMIKKIAAAAALLAAAPAFATITGGGASNTPLGEMFLSVYDSNLNKSYTLDLGAGFTNQASFKNLADANVAGYTKTWTLTGDTSWASYFAASTANAGTIADDKWLVMSIEKNASNTTPSGAKRLLTTIRQGDEAVIPESMNTFGFNSFIGSSQSGTFYTAVNGTGTHSSSANGSSFNSASDGKALVGGTGSVISDNFNGNAQFGNSNLVGQSAQFAYITNASTLQLTPVLVDFFENSAGRGTFAFNVDAGGNANLTYTLAAVTAPIPEPSSYALLVAGLFAVGFVVRRRNHV